MPDGWIDRWMYYEVKSQEYCAHIRFIEIYPNVKNVIKFCTGNLGLHAIKYLSILNACLFLEHFCNIRNLLDLAAVHMSYYCCLDTCNMQQEIFFVVELLCMFTAYILWVFCCPVCSTIPHPARASSLQQSRPRHYNFHRDLWLPDKTRIQQNSSIPDLTRNAQERAQS